MAVWLRFLVKVVVVNRIQGYGPWLGQRTIARREVQKLDVCGRCIHGSKSENALQGERSLAFIRC